LSSDDDGEAGGGFGSGIDSLFTEAFRMIEGSLFDVASKSLRPLFNLEVTDDLVTATFDLPGVGRDEVSITCTEDAISLDAEMTRPVRFRVSSGGGEGEEFARYSRKVLLPVRVDPDKATARFRNGIVTVKLPRRREGRSVRIDADEDVERLG
jgi:HSP20 family protein